MLHKYPFLHVLQSKLYARQFMVPNKPTVEEPTGREEKNAEQEERGTKRKKIVEIEEDDEPGPSLVSSSDHTKPIYHLEFSPEDKESIDEQQKDSENEDSVQDWLPVSCGSVSGKLYKTRFTGASTKSIRAEERWFTPEEFVKQGITLTDGHWERDILCNGKTLKHLVQLDQVKNKLQNNEYKTMKEFVQDINHIYKSSNRLAGMWFLYVREDLSLMVVKTQNQFLLQQKIQ
ncbi:nuclear body protein SP140-like protein [Silurus asotus]|uniref:Nuclear body protein SP140-like protein n=1 Tax=Silurus asotus TaxID=30991 RepID=A0AAD5ASP1_SILAS|nr:nuclear body protein SP140-like protein [Silurus asotus]